MIIDAHTHAWPDKVSLKAQEQLETFFKISLVGNPTVELLKNSMKRNNVHTSIVCAVATKPQQVRSINDWVMSIHEPHIRFMGALHPDYLDWEDELSRVSPFVCGFKFQPEFQNFFVDEERMFGMYEALSSKRIPVLFHCGEELSGTLLMRASPQRIAHVKELFPELIMIAAHFGGFRAWEQVKHYLIGKDIYFDTAFLLGHIADIQAYSMLTAHRSDRILFGTDFPLVDQSKDIEYLKSLRLPVALEKKIFFENSRELFKF